MNELASTESSNLISNFLPRRYAQIYVDKFLIDPELAEDWAALMIPNQDRLKFKEFVMAEFSKRGVANVK